MSRTVGMAGALLALAAGMPLTSVGSAAREPHTLHARTQRPDPPGTINGEVSPHLIPDRTAYSLLLRILTTAQSDDRVERTRAYVRRMSAVARDCEPCGGVGMTEMDIDRLLAHTQQFAKHVTTLDSEATQILRGPNAISPATRLRLAELQAKKNSVVEQYRASIGAVVGPHAAAVVEAFVQRSMKRAIKILPPSTGASAIGGMAGAHKAVMQ